MYKPITYLDEEDPAIFLWQGGKDNQVPPRTFQDFDSKFRERPFLCYLPEGLQSPNEEEMAAAFTKIFKFLDELER